MLLINDCRVSSRLQSVSHIVVPVEAVPFERQKTEDGDRERESVSTAWN